MYVCISVVSVYKLGIINVFRAQFLVMDIHDNYTDNSWYQTTWIREVPL